MRRNAKNPMVWLWAIPIAVGVLAGGASFGFYRADWRPGLQDLWLNVAVTAVAIPITAVLVEDLIQRHERRRWEEVYKQGQVKAAGLAYGVADAIAASLNIPKTLFDPNVTVTSPQTALLSQNVAMLHLIEERLMPAVVQMPRLAPDRQSLLLLWFTDLRTDANQIVVIYGRWLTPETQKIVLAIESQVSSARPQFPMLWAEQFRVDHFRGLFDVHEPPRVDDPGIWIAGTTAGLLNSAQQLLRAAAEHPDLDNL